MIKRITAAMLLILAIALTGCTAAEENSAEGTSGASSFVSAVSGKPEINSEESVSETEVLSMPADTDLSHVREVQPQKPRHGQNQGSKYPAKISELLFVDASSGIPEQIPVFIDPYPSDRGEPDYEITEMVKDVRRRGLTEFLDLLYGNHESREYEEKQDDARYLISYHTDLLEAWGRENGVHVYTREYGVRDDAENGVLLENVMILAAMEYIGITQPQIWQIHEYRQADGDASSYAFRITEQSDDILQNMLADRFRFISVSFDARDKENRDTVKIVAEKAELQEQAQYETVSYQDALDFVQKKYAGRQIMDIQAEVRYEKKVTKGYFVPCYKFHVTYESERPGQDDRETAYDVTYVLMAKDWDVDAPAAG